MKRFVLTMFFTVIAVAISEGQDYKTGLGLRLGPDIGFTVKHSLNGRSAIEGLLTTRWHGFDITGLYEIHNRAFDTDNLKWFYGFGAHLGFYDGDYVDWGRPGSTYNVLGIDGILGLEYTFQDVPINLGLDFKPALNLIDYTGLWAEFGFSIRYVF